MQMTLSLSFDSGDDFVSIFSVLAPALEKLKANIVKAVTAEAPKAPALPTPQTAPAPAATLADELAASGEASIKERQTSTRAPRAGKKGNDATAAKPEPAPAQTEAPAAPETKDDLILKVTTVARRIAGSKADGTDFLGKVLQHYKVTKFTMLEGDDLQQAYKRLVNFDKTGIDDEIPF
jgi:hypothetical protein